MDNLKMGQRFSLARLIQPTACVAMALAMLAATPAWPAPPSQPPRIAPPHDAMLGGDFSPIYQGPYAFILMENTVAGARCSGVLVGSKEVLTAAHCVVSPAGEAQFSAPDYTVVVGGETFSVTQTDFNPSYDPDANVDDSSSRYDMGMLTLDREVTTVAPVPVLRSAAVKRGDTVTLFGYGTNENSTDDLSTLQSLLDQGKSGSLKISSASGGVLHSIHTNSLVVSCAGDSGGPLVRLPSTSHRAVVGLVSAGTTANASNGVCLTTGSDDLSIFVDLQSATSRGFLAKFPRVQYLTPAFVGFKSQVDRVITALKKVQRSPSLATIRKQANSSASTLSKLRTAADTARLPILNSAIDKVRGAKSSTRLSSAQRAVKQSVTLLQSLSALGVD